MQAGNKVLLKCVMNGSIIYMEVIGANEEGTLILAQLSPPWLRYIVEKALVPSQLWKS